MPKKTSTAAGSVGDGTAVKVPVSVTTVWAEAVASEPAARKSAARAIIALRLGAALLDMEMFLSGLESDVKRGHRRLQNVAATSGLCLHKWRERIELREIHQMNYLDDDQCLPRMP